MVLSAVVTGALLWWLLRISRTSINTEWFSVDYAADPIVQMLRDYVRIDTSPDGDEIAGARYLAGLLAEASIESTIEVVGERKANLYAILEGRRREAIGLLSHIDTDPVPDPSAWAHPPFAANIVGPRIFGRGTFDMKGVTISQVVALRELAESGRTPDYSVILMATSSEEVGSELGSQWIVRAHPEIVERLSVVLTEGGVIEARTTEDIKYWGTEVAQKRYVDVWYCSSDKNRLDLLRNEIEELGDSESPRALAPEVAEFLSIYASSRDTGSYAELMENPQRVVDEVAQLRRLPGYARAMFVNQLAPFLVEESPEGGYRLLVKVHLLPGAELEPVLDELLPPWLTFGLERVVGPDDTARHGSPVDHRAMRVIGEVLAEHYPDTPSGPFFLPLVATDSRFFRAVGVPSYGFSPFPTLSTETFQAGKVNERIVLPAFLDGVEIYAELLARLAG